MISNHSADLSKVRTLWFSSIAIGGIFILVWLLLLPFWRSFAGFLNSNDELVNHSVKAMSILIIPYMMLALNLVTDSIFYGIGKTKYMAYQSIITNGTVYVGAFAAYLAGVWTPTFNSILVLFSIGIFVDSLLTSYYAYRVLFSRSQAGDWNRSGDKVLRLSTPA